MRTRKEHWVLCGKKGSERGKCLFTCMAFNGFIRLFAVWCKSPSLSLWNFLGEFYIVRPFTFMCQQALEHCKNKKGYTTVRQLGNIYVTEGLYINLSHLWKGNTMIREGTSLSLFYEWSISYFSKICIWTYLFLIVKNVKREI